MPNFHRIARRSYGFVLGWLVAAPCVARADDPAPPVSPPLAASAPEPPETVIHITSHAPARDIPHTNASQTVISAPQLQQADPALMIPEIIARFVPGASLNADNGLRIRGADDQFSTYLDGAPVPQSISGTITDIFDPKDIQTLRVYTAGFPAEFGGQLSGLFDIQSRSGVGQPSGAVSQSVAGESTYVTDGSISGATGGLGYFASGSRRQTNFFLSPPTETPDHDSGHEDHGFVKLNYAAGAGDTFIAQFGANGSRFEVPDTPDTQQETGTLANLVWQHVRGLATSKLALYSHHSSLIYNGNESLADQAATGELDADQNLNTTYVGVRGDQAWAGLSAHLLRAGFDISQATADQNFTINLAPTSDGPGSILTDDSNPHSWNIGFYAQDDWSVGRFLINYGVRYDENSQDVTKNQVSPRLNVHYRLTGRDTLHAYYDRLFQPVAVEDAVHLVGLTAINDAGTLSPLLPERDDLYEIGFDHTVPGLSLGVSAYYKTGTDVRDDDEVGDTNIQLPVNDAKAYFRGVEFTASGDLSQSLHAYGSLALSWNKNAGPVTGGLNEGGFPTNYFYDDHDQTYTSTFGLAYERRGTFANLTGNYGSGQPYGEIDDADGNATDVNYLRVPPHVLFNIDVGGVTRCGSGVTLFVNNLFNDAYVIKQVTDLSNAQYAEGRVLGVRFSLGF